MYKAIVLCMALALVSCSDDSPATPGTTNGIPDGYGRVRVVAFDSPTDEVDHVYLHVREVNLKTEENAPWRTLARPDTVIDFLDLVNGVNVVIADTLIPTGTYSQLRLVLGPNNTVSSGGETYDLRVPSGMQSGLKINLNFSLADGEVAELYVDFDAKKSVRWNPGQKLYMMNPTFKAYKRTTAGALSGTVRTTTGTVIAGARVEAVGAADDTVATLTGAAGTYLMFLPAGVYTVSASSILQPLADTVYTNVAVTAGAHLQEYDFILR